MKKNDPMPKQQNKKETKRVHNLIIVDESGSMYVIRKQAFVGMNETLQTVRQMQKKYPDQEQRVTLLTFDSGHTTWHYDNAPASRTKETAATPPGITTMPRPRAPRTSTGKPTTPVAAHPSTMPSARVSPRSMHR